MIGNSVVLAAVLAAVSVGSLSLLSVLCLRCKKKSKIIHEERQIYDPRTFQRGGSRFAVTESKTVTRANHIRSTTAETREEFSDISTAANDDQWDYQNVSDAQTGSPEHTYVAPLAISVYVNDLNKGTITDDNQNPAVYANITSSLPHIMDDEEDYENSDFLDKIQEEEDNEPDYVNENG
ncbi:hypothetical protein PBY51_002469 [Eleginops maclovinus]|uniref:Linker for activation of T-cells family member 2 n=2 Tax=Eleginops maclovinus TaxID=56733 RepID=A0AAN7XCU8_ELEMC|nr:hypothetical protein PBY51_002469 [Eleginops maclovinus]